MAKKYGISTIGGIPKYGMDVIDLRIKELEEVIDTPGSSDKEIQKAIRELNVLRKQKAEKRG